MSDLADVAERDMSVHTDVALAQRVIYTGESLSECIECGDEIPEGRQIAVQGVTHCIECAE